jgi:hypothetical protein
MIKLALFIYITKIEFLPLLTVFVFAVYLLVVFTIFNHEPVDLFVDIL